MCEKIIYQEEFHTSFSVLKIKQWPATTTHINMKLTLVILLLLGTTTQMAKSQYSCPYLSRYSINIPNIQDTFTKSYQSAVNNVKYGYQWVKDHFTSTSVAVENYASEVKQGASNAGENSRDTIKNGYNSAQNTNYNAKEQINANN